MSLACGGRGPCCHVGYAHRHCEHCDVVIPITVQPHTHWYGYQQPYYGSIGGLFNQLTNQSSLALQALQGEVNKAEYPGK